MVTGKRRGNTAVSRDLAPIDRAFLGTLEGLDTRYPLLQGGSSLEAREVHADAHMYSEAQREVRLADAIHINTVLPFGTSRPPIVTSWTATRGIDCVGG
jgi:hypothetical protein